MSGAALCTGPLGLCRGSDWERQRARRARAVDYLRTAYLRASLAPLDYLPAGPALAASRSDEDALPPAPRLALEADVAREAAAADRAEARASTLSLSLTGIPGAPSFVRQAADPAPAPGGLGVVGLGMAGALGVGVGWLLRGRGGRR